MFLTDKILGMTPKTFYAVLAAVIVLLVILVVVIIILKRPKRLKVDDVFTMNLITLLGGKKNIEAVSVDNGRLKFKVVDLDLVDLNGIKAIATSGVFVTGSIIKTLFKMDSHIIKSAMDRVL